MLGNFGIFLVLYEICVEADDDGKLLSLDDIGDNLSCKDGAKNSARNWEFIIDTVSGTVSSGKLISAGDERLRNIIRGFNGLTDDDNVSDVTSEDVRDKSRLLVFILFRFWQRRRQLLELVVIVVVLNSLIVTNTRSVSSK